MSYSNSAVSVNRRKSATVRNSGRSRSTTGLAATLLLAAVFGLSGHPALAAPANDNFAGPQILSGGSGSVTGTNVAATKETGEPDHARNSGGKSVWYRWQAPHNGRATFDTIGSNFDTLLAVYTGSSVSTLTHIASDDDGGGIITSRLSFQATAGTVYHIAIDGFGGDAGNIALNWSLLAPPHDAFANAIILNGNAGTRNDNNVGASKEPNERNHAGNPGGASVWYQWTAPGYGQMVINTTGSNFDTLMGVYYGNSVDWLSPVASNDNASGSVLTSSVSFSVEPGTTYYIVVDGKNAGFGAAEGAITLNWSLTAQAPPNDNFVNAGILYGDSGGINGTNVAATKEPGEPNHAVNTGGKSIWYQWTADRSGNTSFDTIGSNFDTLLAVYTGSSVSGLTLVVGNDNSGGGATSSVSFTAARGTTYYIAVDGKNTGSGAAAGLVTLNWSLAAPYNNDFADASPLWGSPGTIYGSNAGATKEAGEPNHGANTGGKSVWYRWQAFGYGQATFDTAGSDFNTLIGVYTGSRVSALTLVSGNDDADPDGTSSVTFSVVPGTTYYIGVDGKNSGSSAAQGNITLNWSLSVQAPPNDNFANAIALTGHAGSINGTNVAATKETGEPNHAGYTGGKSVWYRWQAPGTGNVRFDTNSSFSYSLLGVYTGSSVGALTLIDSGEGWSSSVSFSTVAGAFYYIAVDDHWNQGGAFTLNWSSPPPHDHFSNAQLLSGDSGSVEGSNIDATKETGEPDHAGYGGGKSVWYRWQAPGAGRVRFDTSSNFYNLVGVYTGSSVDGLTPVGSGQGWGNSVSFSASGGTLYYIAVDDYWNQGGSFTLNWRFATETPPNDNFANAQILNGATGTVAGSNAGATKETGEPDHGGNSGGKSIWYRWQAPHGGYFRFSASGNRYNLMGVYTGSTVSALTAVGSGHGWSSSSVNFIASPGTVYYIAADDYYDEGDFITLTWASLPPPNDDFTYAITLDGSSGTVNGNNGGAGKETGEPVHAGNSGGKSVWYQWSTSGYGQMVINTTGSDFDTLLGVYTGSSVAALTPVVSNDNASGGALTSSVSFTVVPGATYYIAVDGKDNGSGAAQGHVVLNWSLTAQAPPHDNFSNAVVLSGNVGSVSSSNGGATKETGEPDHAGNSGGKSVWYRWQAPGSGMASFDLDSVFPGLIEVYTGSSVSALTPVASSQGWSSSVSFSTSDGTVYYIAVDDYGDQGGLFTLDWAWDSNDNFANAVVLNGNAGTINGSNVDATLEDDEPNHDDTLGGKSVWYEWMSPGHGQATFNTAGSSFDTLLAVYTGNNMQMLTPVGSNDDANSSVVTSAVTIPVAAGVTYFIAVDGKEGAKGNITLNWSFAGGPPPNDNFGNAEFLSGDADHVNGTNLRATKEAGEPNHVGNIGGKSVWYRWQASSYGEASITTINTSGSVFNTLLAVYTGSSMNALTLVANNDGDGFGGTSSVTFNAQPGIAYYIAVDGKNTGSGAPQGSLTLHWSLIAQAPPHDNFANAITLSGKSGSIASSNVKATEQSGEPDHAGNTGGASVWYRWQAPGSGSVTFDTSGSNFDTLLGVYTGNSVGALTRIASDDDNGGDGTSSLSFAASAGTIYYIAVDGHNSDQGSLILNWSLLVPPAITSLTPNSGINIGPVNITNLAGTDFVAGATVKLTKAGQSDIVATNGVVVSATKMTCTFDLNGKTAGGWNVVVTNADGQSATLANGFTVIAAVHQPDVLIKNSAEAVAAYGVDNVYQSTPAGGQIESLATNPAVATGYDVLVQNDGNTARTFVLKATEDGATGWTVTYQNGATDISTQMRGASGYTTPVLAPGASIALSIVITPGSGVTGGTSKSIVIKSFLDGADTTVRDAVQATTTVNVAAQADLFIKNGAEPGSAYVLDNVYQTTPAGGQIKSQSVNPSVTATYHVAVQNDGNTARSFVLKATDTALAGWVTAYKNGATDVSAAMLGASGYTTPAVAPGASFILTVLVTPGSGAAGASSKIVIVKAFLDGADTTVDDAVQATTTVNVAAQADLFIKNGAEPGSAYVLDNVYQTTPAGGQIKSQAVNPSVTATYHVAVQNDGNTARPFVLKATDTALSGWVTAYKNGATDVSAAMLGASGYTTPAVAPGTSFVLTVLVTPGSGAAGASSKSVIVKAFLDGADTTVRDAVQATTTVNVAAQADLFIKNGAEAGSAYVLDNVYQTTPAGGQIKSQSVNPNVTATYHVAVQNDGNTARSFVLKATDTALAGWVTAYRNGATDISTAMLGASGYTTPVVAPGTSFVLTVLVTPGSGAAGGSSKSVIVKAFLDGADATVRDAVQATTTVNVAAKSDLLIKKGTDAVAAYALDNVYQATPAGEQIESQSTSVNVPVSSHVLVQNDGNTARTFVIKAGEDGATGWTVAYQNGAADISAAVRGASGYTTPSLAPGTSLTLTVVMTPGAGVAGGTAKSTTLRVLLNAADAVAQDTVKAVATLNAIFTPDLQISVASASGYVGDNIYNTTGLNQTKTQTVPAAGVATYYAWVQNDGNAAHSFRLTAPVAPAGWIVRYYDVTSGQEIGGAVTGAGWATPPLAVGAGRLLRVTVQPGSTVAVGTVNNVLVTATSTSDATKKDTVKATTTVGTVAARSAAEPQLVTALSSVTISSGVARVSAHSIQLTFTGPLDGAVAGEAAHYRVEINGQETPVQSAVYNSNTQSVTLALAAGALRGGDRVMVSWDDLRDTKAAFVTGQIGPLTAR